MSVMIGSRTAQNFTRFMFCLAIFMSLEGTFISLDFLRAVINISAAFVLYFLIRNPNLLIAKNFDEFGDLLEDAIDKKFIWGTTPIYPAILLCSISYIALMKYGSPF